METIVRCVRADSGECKALGCSHFLEHTPKMVSQNTPCTSKDKCPVVKKITYCKLKIEN